MSKVLSQVLLWWICPKTDINLWYYPASTRSPSTGPADQEEFIRVLLGIFRLYFYQNIWRENRWFLVRNGWLVVEVYTAHQQLWLIQSQRLCMCVMHACVLQAVWLCSPPCDILLGHIILTPDRRVVLHSPECWTLSREQQATVVKDFHSLPHLGERSTLWSNIEVVPREALQRTQAENGMRKAMIV